MLVEYVRVVLSSASCPDRAPFTPADRARAFSTYARLTQGIAGASRADGVDLLPAAALSAGHDVCSAHPWVFGYNPAPAQDPSFPHAQYHPNGRAMEVIAFALDRMLYPR